MKHSSIQQVRLTKHRRYLQALELSTITPPGRTFVLGIICLARCAKYRRETRLCGIIKVQREKLNFEAYTE